MRGYTHTADRGDCFIGWASINPNLTAMVREAVASCASQKRYAGCFLLLAKPLAGGEHSVGPAVDHLSVCLLYGYFTLRHSGVVLLGVDKYELVSACCQALKGFTTACGCLGRPVAVEPEQLRELVIFLIHSLTARLIFRKTEIKAASGGIRLLLNVITFPYEESSFLGVTKSPKQVRVLGGQPIIVSKHYLELRNSIRQNRRGSGTTSCYDAKHLNTLHSTRFYLDTAMINRAIALFRSQDPSLEFIKTAAQAAAYVGEAASRQANERRYKESGGFADGGAVGVSGADASSLYSLLLARENQFYLRGGFYYSYYMDFRGRMYSDGPLSYTHSK